MSEQAVHRCVCAQLHPRELLLVWQHRAQPIVRRMAMHARPVDMRRLQVTLSLIEKMQSLHEDCFSAAFSGHSHHVKNCPAARRNHGKDLPTPSASDVVISAMTPVPAWRVR